MLFKEIMNQQWEAGHQEGRIDILQEVIFESLEQYGKLPDTLVSKIKNEKDESVLKNLVPCRVKGSVLRGFYAKHVKSP